MRAKGVSAKSLLLSIVVAIAVSPALTGALIHDQSDVDRHDGIGGGGVSAPQSYPLLAEHGGKGGGVASGLGGYFIENAGQIRDSAILFYGSRNNVQFGFTRDSFLLKVMDRQVFLTDTSMFRDDAGGPPRGIETRGVLVKIIFAGAREVTPRASGELPHRSNFLLGNDPALWRTGVRNYEEIEYDGIYEGIDLRFRISSGGLKYEFVVDQGADPESIVMAYEGIEALRIEGGALVLDTEIGELRDAIPYSYHVGGGEIACDFVGMGEFSVGFRCDGWDRSGSLVIDPLAYSTFLGGTTEDAGNAIAVDTAGNAYVTGFTDSADFPTTPGVFSTSNSGGYDIFVAKLNESGGSLIYSTYIGGMSEDVGSHVSINPAGDAYVAGWTTSSDFPTTIGAYSRSLSGGRDIIVLELDPSGASLLHSTYIGGTLGERAQHMYVDSSGNAYLTGDTDSGDFPTTAGAYDRTYNGGGNDAFATMLDSTGGTLGFSSFLGGSGEDEGHVVIADSARNVFVLGHAGGGNFPTTPGVFDRTFRGTSDVFVAKLNPSGSTLIFSTFLGGSNGDDGYAMKINAAGEPYVSGKTYSSDFPTTAGAFDTGYNGGSYDVYVTRLNSTGTGLIFSTFIGGSADDVGYDLALNQGGIATVAGETSSGNFPTTSDGYDRTQNGGSDCFISALSPMGDQLLYSTFLGGTDTDVCAQVSFGPPGYLYVVGLTRSPDFPTTMGAFDITFNGLPSDAFVSKFGVNFPPVAKNLGVQGFTAPPRITHITDFMPTLNWTYYDAEGEAQASYDVRVGSTPGTGNMWVPGPAAGGATSLTYAGAPLSRGTDYYFGVRVADWQWGGWSEVRFHVNSIPSPPPSAVDPPHLATVPANASQTVTWGASTDKEGDVITYQWEVAIDSAFSTLVAAGFGTTTTSSSFSTSVGTTYYWRARARDSYEPTAWSAYGSGPPGWWSFSVVDNPPTAVAFAPVTRSFMGVALTFDGTGSTDDVGIVSYLWQFGDGSTDTNVLTTHAYASRRTFAINLTVWDTIGQNDTDTLSILIENRPPVADAGLDQSALRGTLVALDGMGSSDPDGDSLTYAWNQTGGPIVVLTRPDTAAPTFAPSIPGIYSFILTVHDGWGGSSNDTVNVTAVNRPPIADAGPDRGGLKRTLITLDGTGSSDPDGDSLTYAWSQTGGPVVALAGSTTATPFFTPSSSGTYIFTLMVGDGWGGWSNDTVNVTVANRPPTADAGPDHGGLKRTAVALDGTGSSDPDGDTLAYSWTQTDGPAPVTLAGASTARPTFTPPRVGTYAFHLLVNDGDGGTSQDDVAVTVWGLPPIARLVATPPSAHVGMEIAFQGNGSADPDGMIVAYAFDFGDGSTVNGTASQVGHAYARAGSYNVTLTVTDDDGNTSVARAFVSIDQPPGGTNWKPLMALVFAIVLGAVGMWPARRRPWKGVRTRQAAFKSWYVMSLPFVILEAATGVVSLFTGLLAVPPILGLGMIVDLLILVGGVATLALLSLTAKKDEAGETPRPDTSTRQS